MQVFKAMFKITKKRLPSALAYIIVFIVISVIASSNASKDSKFEMTKLKICIFDEDDTSESRELSELIAQNHDIVEIENDRDVIIDSLYYKRADYVLVINEGYAEKLKAGDTADIFASYCLDESFSTVYMGQFLDEYTNSVKAYLSMGMPIDDALSCTEEALSQETDVSMLRNDKGGDAHYSVDFAAYFQYMPYILISAVFIIVCQVLVTMNRRDIRFRTNCSCISSSKYTFQLFLGSGFFVLAVWLLFMAVGVMLNKEMYTGRAWYAVFNSLIFSAVVAAIAVFVSSFEPADNILNLITQVLGLGLSFLCGVFIPREILSDKVLSVARFLPAYWYINANEMIADVIPFSSEGVIQCYLIQLGFAAALILLTLLVRKVRYSGAAISTNVRKTAVSH